MQDFHWLFGGFLRTECMYFIYFSFPFSLDSIGLEDRLHEFEVIENELLHILYIFPENCAYSAMI